jgi:hypothetical protein
MIGSIFSGRAAVSTEGIKDDTGAAFGIEYDCGPLEPGSDLREQLKPLASQRGFEEGEAGDVPARAVEPRDDVPPLAQAWTTQLVQFGKEVVIASDLATESIRERASIANLSERDAYVGVNGF